MIRALLLTVLLALVPLNAHADASWTFDPNVPMGFGGAVGMELDKKSADPWPTCLMWTLDGGFCWGAGMDVTRDYPGTPDLVLAYSKDTNADNLRLRADDARTMLGPRVGHPQRPFQLDVETDYRNSGLCVGTSGWQTSVLCWNQQSPVVNRVSLNLNNLWQWATDIGSNGGTDLYLWNYTANQPALLFSGGGGIGFFGSPAVTRPVVGGSWSDGSAARSVLAALVSLGLVADGTRQ